MKVELKTGKTSVFMITVSGIGESWSGNGKHITNGEVTHAATTQQHI